MVLIHLGLINDNDSPIGPSNFRFVHFRYPTEPEVNCVGVLRPIRIAGDDLPDGGAAWVINGNPRSHWRTAPPLLAQSKSNPISGVYDLVLEGLDGSLHGRPTPNRGHEQVHFAVAIKIISHHIARIRFEADSEQVGYFNE